MIFSLLREHPSHIAWKVDPDVISSEFFLQSKFVKDIQKTENILRRIGYEIRHEVLTEKVLNHFVEKYTYFLERKPRGVVFPVKDRVAQDTTQGLVFSLLSLYSKEGEFIGGLLYSEDPKNRRITTVYKALPHDVPERKRFPESLAYVFTLAFFRIASEKKYREIFHGIDRNPYGFYSNIGLGLFKVRAGCVPHVPRTEKMTLKQTIDYRTDEDMWLWLGNTPETPITKAILITKLPPEEAKEKYKPLFLLDGVTIEVWNHETYIKSLPKE